MSISSNEWVPSIYGGSGMNRVILQQLSDKLPRDGSADFLAGASHILSLLDDMLARDLHPVLNGLCRNITDAIRQRHSPRYLLDNAEHYVVDAHLIRKCMDILVAHDSDVRDLRLEIQRMLDYEDIIVIRLEVFFHSTSETLRYKQSHSMNMLGAM